MGTPKKPNTKKIDTPDDNAEEDDQLIDPKAKKKVLDDDDDDFDVPLDDDLGRYESFEDDEDDDY